MKPEHKYVTLCMLLVGYFVLIPGYPNLWTENNIIIQSIAPQDSVLGTNQKMGMNEKLEVSVFRDYNGNLLPVYVNGMQVRNIHNFVYNIPQYVIYLIILFFMLDIVRYKLEEVKQQKCKQNN